MISRVAECCFWLTRYLERADNVARLLRVNRALVLDAELGWMPLIVVVGEKERYQALFEDEDGEHVQNYLTWDDRSPVSIMSSIRWMRENARMIREVMSLESWQCANRFWTWLCSDGARARYHDDTDEFYARVTSLSVEMQGWTQNTMMHDRPLDFMSLGRALERASQTARTLDVKYHMLGATKPDRLETPLELAEWVALLNSCSAAEPFFKRKNDTPRGPRVAEFLLFDADLPRSIRHCVAHAHESLLRIRKPLPDRIGDESLRQLLKLHEHLEEGSIETVLHRGIHEELTFVVDSISEICNQVHFDYFDPQPAPP